METSLNIDPGLSIQAQNGGLFVSTRADWMHPRRVIGSFELIFVKEGVLSVREDGIEWTVQANETLVLWPHRVHEHGEGQRSARNLKFYWVHFTVAEGRDAGASLLQIPQHSQMARPDHMTSLFRRLLDDQELYGASSTTLGLLTMLLLCEVARSAAVGEPTPAASALAAKARVVIQTKFSGPITASSIAAELRCNPDYLGRVFRSMYGKTMTEAIHERRVRNASHLLTETRLTIDEIARQCGFVDLAYFRRVFKRYAGMSPSMLRALHTRTHINNS